MLQSDPDQPDTSERKQETPPYPRARSGNAFQQSISAIVRSALAILGALLIPIGVVIAFLTPILPIGLPIVIVGVVLLARNAVWGRRFVQGTLRKYPKLERFAPDWLLKLIFGEGKA